MKPYVAFTDDAILEGATLQKKLPEGWAWAPSPVETLPAPITEELKDTQVWELGVPPIPWEAESDSDEPAPTEEPTNKPVPAEEPTNELATSEEPTDKLATAEEPPEELATVEEPTVEPAILTATMGEPAEEPETPYAVQEGRKEGSST